MKNCILNNLKTKDGLFIAIIFLIMGFIIGLIINIRIKKTNKSGFNSVLKKIIDELNNFVLVGTFFLAFIMYGIQMFCDKIDNSKVFDVLSFYVSFIFAWLLTQKSSKSEFEKQEKKLGEMAYRHIYQLWISLGEINDDVNNIIEKYRNDDENLDCSIIVSDLNGLNSCLKYIRSTTSACVNDWGHIIDKDMEEHRDKKITNKQKKDIDESAKKTFKDNNLSDIKNSANY